MPDISLCFGLSCDRRQHCYRFTAQPKTRDRQSYLMLDADEQGDDCLHYWPAEPVVPVPWGDGEDGD